MNRNIFEYIECEIFENVWPIEPVIFQVLHEMQYMTHGSEIIAGRCGVEFVEFSQVVLER